ncbi:MAG: MarR family winged helix-turn-helix transcriptional regulator [Bacteroidia bacterium]
MSNHSDLYNILPFGRHLSVLTKMYIGALTKKLAHLDIERHYSILVLIESCEENCTQQFLSGFLRIDKASMVRIVDYLVKKKYVKRAVNPSDRREHRLELTPKAKKAMPGIHKAIKALNTAAFKGMSKKQAQDFHKSISVVRSNLSREPANTIIINYKKAKQA